MSVCFLPPTHTFFFSFLFHTMQLAGSWFSSQGSSLSLWGKRTRRWTTKELPAPRNINQRELCQRSPSQLQDPGPPNCLQAPVLDASFQTTSKTGTQSHPSADRLPKDILSSQTPQNTPPDAVLPIRGTRLSSTHQNTATSPSQHEGYTSPWTKLTHQGAETRSKGTMTLQPEERRPQTQ